MKHLRINCCRRFFLKSVFGIIQVRSIFIVFIPRWKLGEQAINRDTLVTVSWCHSCIAIICVKVNVVRLKQQSPMIGAIWISKKTPIQSRPLASVAQRAFQKPKTGISSKRSYHWANRNSWAFNNYWRNLWKSAFYFKLGLLAGCSLLIILIHKGSTVAWTNCLGAFDITWFVWFVESVQFCVVLH